MSDSKHTPGEWLVRGLEPGSDDVRVVIERDGVVSRVATVHCPQSVPFKKPTAADVLEWVPNARLIAAAPDLLDVLEFIQWSSKHWEDGVNHACCPWCDEPVENGHLTDCRIAAAIAKARGEA